MKTENHFMQASLAPDLAGKRVLVTGASTGIGAAAAEAFAAAGCRVVVHFNTSRDAASSVAKKIKDRGGDAHLVQGDVRTSAVARRVVAESAEKLGGIDVLVNNAGGLVKRVPVAEIDDAIFDEIVDLNVRSLVAACAAAVPHMRKAGGGKIINVTSVAARHGGGPGAVLYAGSKGFVSTMTHGLAKELVKDNIRVNAVAPGVIYTPFHERYSSPQMLEGFKATIPMNRIGTADECAGAFLFLASDQMSGYVTGQILEVNGGQYMP
jgi:3-oxoacyl-[acyl-carrier protein] reductase